MSNIKDDVIILMHIVFLFVSTCLVNNCNNRKYMKSDEEWAGRNGLKSARKEVLRLIVGLRQINVASILAK